MANVFGIVGDNLNAAYAAADNQLGGFLPGGVDVDAASFARNVVKDVVPGRNFTSAESAAAKGGSTAADFMKGRLDLAQSKMRTAKATSQFREGIVEELGERFVKNAGKRLATKGPMYGLPVVGQAAGVYDTVQDAGAIADAVVEFNTGKTVGAHWDDTREMRDEGRGLDGLFPEAEFVGDGSPQTVSQGSKVNPFWQEANNRATQYRRKVNPLHGDLGISELFGWN